MSNPTVDPEERSPEQEMAERGLVLVRARDDLDRIESAIIEARLTGEEAADAYLYVIMPRCPSCRTERPPGKGACPHCGVVPEKALSKPIVGPTVDFKRLVASMLNATGKAKLTPLRDHPPIVQDVQIHGRPYVRVMACVVDELTGVAKWAVKEEARTGAHAATVALEKAEGKALESHPSFNRKLVNKKIREFLRRQGLDPRDFVIGGGGGTWGALFGRAKAAGVPPEAVREAVREATGKGLSEVAEAAEAQAAVAAVDGAIAKRTPRNKRARPTSPPPPTGEAPPETPATSTSVEAVRAKILEVASHIGLSEADRRTLWKRVGPVGVGEGVTPTIEDYQRMLATVNKIATGASVEDAVMTSLAMYPRAKET